MNDDNWDLITGPPAHHIEQLNATNVINLLEALLTLLIHSYTEGTHQTSFMPNETALKELHRAGTIFLLTDPGEYRVVNVHVGAPDGTIVHQPPSHEAVAGLMGSMFSELAKNWLTWDALDAASFALWKVNWIHPFKNGNGRTARAFCYACLNSRLGVILPGTTTVIDQIMGTRPRYEALLRAADKTFADTDAVDLRDMKAYLNELLQIQIASVS